VQTRLLEKRGFAVFCIFLVGALLVLPNIQLVNAITFLEDGLSLAFPVRGLAFLACLLFSRRLNIMVLMPCKLIGQRGIVT